MKQKEIDKLVYDELEKLFDKTPVKLVGAMMVIFAKHLVDANSKTTTITQESTIENQRYNISATIIIKPVKNKVFKT